MEKYPLDQSLLRMKFVEHNILHMTKFKSRNTTKYA
jgi:hypothetical protein